MAVITELSLRNFRGFAKVERLRLAPLTFLVGPNNSGKSSIADALLFMAQSGFLSLEATNPIWMEPLVDLGSFKDTVFRHETERAIEIGVRLDKILVMQTEGAGRHRAARMNAVVSAEVKTAKDVPEGQLTRLVIREPGVDSDAMLVRRSGRHKSFEAKADGHELPYVPRPWQVPARVLAKLLMGTGKRRHPSNLSALLDGKWLGQFAQTIQRVSSGRDPPRRSYVRDGSSAGERRLLNGIDAAALDARRDPDQIQALVEGLRALGIASDIETSRAGDYHSVVQLKDDVTALSSNLADFGYGASQVIPVLEGCATRGSGPLFVEQPEIHLHPRAQGQLAQILCDASAGRQMIVETHSEHMINRARRLVAEGRMKADDVVIQYIDRNADGSHALMIGLDDAGDFTRDWPDGFYDERYQETMRIAEAQSKRAAE